MAQALPFPNSSFDSIVSAFPSEYISDPATLDELARVLRPGGRLVVVLGGWLHSKGASGKAMESVARGVYGYKSAPDETGATAIEQVAHQESGWYNWITVLRGRMDEAGFNATPHVASNAKGACLVVVAEMSG